jgi:hypothetical protein
MVQSVKESDGCAVCGHEEEIKNQRKDIGVLVVGVYDYAGKDNDGL